jgi:hypothetical protein
MEWSSAVPEVLRELLPRAAEGSLIALRDEVPAYADPLRDAQLIEVVRLGVLQAVERFVAAIAAPGTPADPEWREGIRSLGRSAEQGGRQLETLQSAFRVGIRLAWREVAAAGTARGIEPAELYRLAEELFIYLDELSSLAAEGFAAERADRAGRRRQLRRALAELLLSTPAPDAAAVSAAAHEAQWTVPATLAVVALEGERREQLAGRIDPDVLVISSESGGTLIVPDAAAAGTMAIVRTTFAEQARAALGPTVAVGEAAVSAARARQALALIQAGVLPGEALLVCEEHLLQLLLHVDERLWRELRGTALAPLHEVPESTRSKLIETLRAFLDHEGRMDPTARSLGVHPQTVRYRVAQLRELFGRAMDDPEQRLLLSLALRA